MINVLVQNICESKINPFLGLQRRKLSSKEQGYGKK